MDQQQKSHDIPWDSSSCMQTCFLPDGSKRSQKRPGSDPGMWWITSLPEHAITAYPFIWFDRDDLFG